MSSAYYSTLNMLVFITHAGWPNLSHRCCFQCVIYGQNSFRLCTECWTIKRKGKYTCWNSPTDYSAVQRNCRSVLWCKVDNFQELLRQLYMAAHNNSLCDSWGAEASGKSLASWQLSGLRYNGEIQPDWMAINVQSLPLRWTVNNLWLFDSRIYLQSGQNDYLNAVSSAVYAVLFELVNAPK